jgi:hypothetical protein
MGKETMPTHKSGIQKPGHTEDVADPAQAVHGEAQEENQTSEIVDAGDEADRRQDPEDGAQRSHGGEMRVSKAEAQNGRPFEKGRSGNPRGRPKGSRNKATLLTESILDDHASLLAEKLVEMALSEDVSAMALCMKHLLPANRKRTIELDLPPLVTIHDGMQILSITMKAVAQGDISVEDAQQLSALVDLHRRLLENVDMDNRIRKLELAQEKRLSDERDSAPGLRNGE